jgi:hypothetical protein
VHHHRGTIRCAKNLILQGRSRPSLLSSPAHKNISLYPSGKSSLQARAIPCPHEGRIATVTDVGRGRRWTRMRRQTSGATSGRRSRVVLAPRCWRQLGDDASHHAGDGGKKADQQGEHEAAVKPPCRESRIAPAYLWSNSCAFFAAHEAAGALSIRLSLRPLFRGGMFFKTRAVFGCGKARP